MKDLMYTVEKYLHWVILITLMWVAMFQRLAPMRVGYFFFGVVASAMWILMSLKFNEKIAEDRMGWRILCGCACLVIVVSFLGIRLLDHLAWITNLIIILKYRPFPKN